MTPTYWDTDATLEYDQNVIRSSSGEPTYIHTGEPKGGVVRGVNWIVKPLPQGLNRHGRRKFYKTGRAA